jgi:hypothetical protein
MLAEVKRRAESLVAKAKAVREKGEGILDQGIRSVEIGGTAFAFGYLQGRYGKDGGVTIGPVPIELAVAIAGHGAGFLRLGGKHSYHLHNVADGALATYASTLGRGIGKAAAKKTSGMSGDAEDGRRGMTASRDALRNLKNYRRASA